MLEFDDVLCLYTVYDQKILQKTHCFRGLLYSRIKTISNINSNVIAVNYQDDDRIIWCKCPFVNRKIKNTKEKKCLMVTSPQPKKPFPTRLWNVWSLSDFSHKCSLFKMQFAILVMSLRTSSFSIVGILYVISLMYSGSSPYVFFYWKWVVFHITLIKLWQKYEPQIHSIRWKALKFYRK